jgi:N-acetylglucosaminyldiphosphoundecaprenol N-acetyl-beta-D-mannosaminyltransferase
LATDGRCSRLNQLKNAMENRQFPDLYRPVYDVAGLPFDAIDLAQAVEQVIAAVQSRTPLFISTPNLNFLIAAQTDQAFLQSVRDSGLSLADGMPIVWLARLLGVPIRQRVAGSDLFEALCQQSRRTVKVFFFGGPDGAAQRACDRVNARAQDLRRRGLLPGVQCVGIESPGFGSLDDMSRPALIDRINACGADFVVVALGAKKGQAWIQRNRRDLNSPVISHLGAVVNMAAGTIVRAPHWMRVVGLEWIWRIKEEPWLWKRYGSDGLAMARLMLSDVLPQVLRQRWQRHGGGPQQPVGTHEIKPVAGGCRLVLKGSWTIDAIDALRSALADCARGGMSITVDTHAATYLDAAVRGLLGIVSAPADPPPVAVQGGFK